MSYPYSAIADGASTPVVTLAGLPGFGAVPSVVAILPTDGSNNSVSTQDTLAVMAAMVKQSLHSPVVASAVADALGNGGWELEERGQIGRVFYWIKRNVKFTDDESRVAEIFDIPLTEVDQELLISPERLLTMPVPMGDCDDFSMLMATMLGQLGIPVVFVAICADDSQKWRFSHVYTRAILSTGEVLPLDCSHGEYPGWESPVNFGEMVQVANTEVV